MRFSALLPVVAACLFAGCKTPSPAAGSSVKDAEMADNAAFSLSTLPNSHWHAEFTADYIVKADLTFDQGTGGMLSLSVDGDTQARPFATVRFSDAGELKQYVDNVAGTQPDSMEQPIAVTTALTLLDADGNMVNMFPILHASELFMQPIGPLKLVADNAEEGEAEQLKCGGLAGKKCPATFACAYRNGTADAGGVCVKSTATSVPPTQQPQTQGGAGSKCGGFAGLPCNAGFKCTHTTNFLDGMGRCAESTGTPQVPSTPTTTESSHGLGSKCGGFAGIGCDSGFHCSTANSPDGFGRCAQNTPSSGSTTPPATTHGLNSQCGGLAAIKCDSGFRCSNNSGIGDGMGRCVVSNSNQNPTTTTTPGASEPTFCGGFGGLKCKAPKVCRYAPPRLDGMGICAQP